jgi:protein tyrosine phosphatase
MIQTIFCLNVCKLNKNLELYLFTDDETRVKIEPELEDETDFINASYVKVSEQAKIELLFQ